MEWMGMMMTCGMAVKRMGMLEVCVRKMMAPTVKMETVTMTGKGRCNLTCFMYMCKKVIVKYFFLADVLFLGYSPRFG